MKLNFSLKKIWTTIVLLSVLMPTLVATTWFGIRTYENQLTYALTSERQTNILKRNQIESEVRRFKTIIKNKTDALSLVVKEKNNNTTLKHIHTLLRAIVEREPAILKTLVLSTQSKIITGVEPAYGILGNRPLTAVELLAMTDRAGFNSPYTLPEVIIPSLGRIYIGAPKVNDNKFIFTMAAPIGNPANAILILFIYINKLWLIDNETAYRPSDVSATHSYMLDRRGMLLTKVDNSNFNTGKLVTHLAIARTALINEPWPTTTSYIGLNNQPVFGTLTTIPSLNWALISEVIVSKITWPIWISLFNVMLLTLFCLVLFTWFVLNLSNKTLRPIQDLCAAIDRVAQGDYQIELKSTGIPEFDRMASGINRMTKARAKAEAGLKHQENEQRQMLNSMVNAVISIDETGAILSFNTAAEDLFGYSSKEALGLNVNKLMPAPYATEHDGYLKNYLTTGVTHVIGSSKDVEGLHKDKDTFPVRLLVAELPKGENGERRFIGSCIDLTDSKQQEEQIRRSQKMDALGKLTGGIAHDYNNMLVIIMGYATLLQRSLGQDKKLASYASEIHHAAERSAKLTKKLLNFSGKRSSDVEVINLNLILQDEQNMLAKILTARIKLVLDLSSDLWLTNLDASDLEDAILNISINAMHAIEQQGQLTIQTKNEHINELDARLLNLPQGDYVSLSITDTGCGMDEATREKIFEPFYSTKGEQGTGLGLSQVYGFIKRSRGSIKVYSELGHGSRFTIYFPRHYENSPDVQNNNEENNEIQGGNETILIVDDETALLTLNAEVLNKNGYKTICAESAQEALTILDHQHVDVLLTDIIMPEIDGYQLAAMVKEKHPNVKIQLASGFNDNHNAELVDKTLHKNILNKPFNSQQLFARIRTLLDEKES